MTDPSPSPNFDPNLIRRTLDAERQVLSSVLFDADRTLPQITWLHASDFADSLHQTLFRTAVEAHRAGRPVDPTAVAQSVSRARLQNERRIFDSRLAAVPAGDATTRRIEVRRHERAVQLIPLETAKQMADVLVPSVPAPDGELAVLPVSTPDSASVHARRVLEMSMRRTFESVGLELVGMSGQLDRAPELLSAAERLTASLDGFRERARQADLLSDAPPAPVATPVPFNVRHLAVVPPQVDPGLGTDRSL